MTTIRNWVRKYDIPCERNDKGHFVFHQEALDTLILLKKQNGVLNDEPPTEKEGLPIDEFYSRMDALVDRVDKIDRELKAKADDVVTVQMLQHRREMDELIEKVEHVERKIDRLVSQINQAPEQQEQSTLNEKPKRKRLLHRFGF
ncbi:hypothetical protein G4V62_01740 [Bacillaceae bacterium SIJ1]|nr:hypothetical protein [Litoribacterium kuwaitense]